MTKEQLEWLIAGSIIAIVLIVFICLIVADVKKNKDKYVVNREKMRELEDERLQATCETITTHATVVDMACGVNALGIKQPKAVKYFVIQFKQDNGNLVNLSVPEEFYDGFDVGLSGILTMVDGELHSFEPDEE